RIGLPQHTLSGNLSHISRQADRGRLTLDFLHVRRNVLARFCKESSIEAVRRRNLGGGYDRAPAGGVHTRRVGCLIESQQADALPARLARGDSGLQGRRDVAVSSK